MWVKNTEGKKDAMLTFAVIAFGLVILNLFLATFGAVTLFGVTFTFTMLSAGTITALLGPTLTAYVGRRFTGAAYPEYKSKGKRPIQVPHDADGVLDGELETEFDPTGEL